MKVGQGHLIQESGGCHRSDLVVGQISVSTDQMFLLYNIHILYIVKIQMKLLHKLLLNSADGVILHSSQ